MKTLKRIWFFMRKDKNMDRGSFYFEKETNRSKYYSTKDKGYALIIRVDGLFMLYKKSEEADVYDWVERRFRSFEECEKYMAQQK